MTRDDAFLGGRLVLRQPARGYRAGADAVMLAAACPARAGERVLELGCGAGVALFCLGARVPGLDLTGLERQPGMAELARHNAEATGIAARRMRRMPYSGSPVRPRCPVVACWMRWRHTVSLSAARCTTWNGSITVRASGTALAAAVW